ncbi:MAG: hypothetical protein WDZ35_15200 [Crocinitomicaceae bacterium]
MVRFLLFIALCFSISCTTVKNSSINPPPSPFSSLERKIQGFWEADKVEYAIGYTDNNPQRSFEFDKHGFFQVTFYYKSDYRIKANLFKVEDEQIKLINKNTHEVFEILKIKEITSSNLTLQTIYPKNNTYTVYLQRI